MGTRIGASDMEGWRVEELQVERSWAQVRAGGGVVCRSVQAVHRCWRGALTSWVTLSRRINWG